MSSAKKQVTIWYESNDLTWWPTLPTKKLGLLASSQSILLWLGDKDGGLSFLDTSPLVWLSLSSLFIESMNSILILTFKCCFPICWRFQWILLLIRLLGNVIGSNCFHFFIQNYRSTSSHKYYLNEVSSSWLKKQPKIKFSLL